MEDINKGGRINLDTFYQSKAWQKCRRHIIADALATEGAL